MKLERMVDGHHTQHAGITHTLKHYLSPLECWDDLAVCGDALRPRAVISRLAVEPPPHRQWKNPSVALRGVWESLSQVHRDGYHHTTATQVEPVPPPPTTPWKRLAPDGKRGVRWASSSTGGVVMIVGQARGGFELKTAYRPECAAASYHLIPSDPPARERRIRNAGLEARRLIAGMQGDEA